jgi:hypothetical protein
MLTACSFLQLELREKTSAATQDRVQSFDPNAPLAVTWD